MKSIRNSSILAVTAVGLAGLLSGGAAQAQNLITDGDFEACALNSVFTLQSFSVANAATHDKWLDNDWKCVNDPEADSPASGNYARYAKAGENQQLFQGFPVTSDSCVVPGSKLNLSFSYIAKGEPSVTLDPRIIAYGFGPDGTWSRFAGWPTADATLLLGATAVGFPIPRQPNWASYEKEFEVDDDYAAIAVGFRFGFQGGQGGDNVDFLQGLDNVDLRLSYFPAEVDIDPNSLNRRSRGNPVIAYISVPDCFDAADIDPETVQLTEINGDVLTPPLDAYHWDVQGNLLMVQFSRQAVIAELGAYSDDLPGDFELTIEGELEDGTAFSAADTIYVFN
jgi:hypothetical protein